MSDKVLELNSNTFDAYTVDGLALIDFWAPWCGPCRMQAPVLDELSNAVGESVQIAKVNVDDEPDLAVRFGVQAIPLLVLLKDGQEVRRFVGVQSRRALEAAIAEQG